MRSATLSQEIKLLEPALFLRTDLTPNSNYDSRPKDSVLRGSLIVHVRKCTNIKSIMLNLRGRYQIVWPERDGVEDRVIHNQSQSLFGSGSLNVTLSSDPLNTENTRIGTHYIVLPGEGAGLGLIDPRNSEMNSNLNGICSSSSTLSMRNRATTSIGMTVPVGIYEFPFELVVPSTIPASMECIYGKVDYHLCARIERSSVLHTNMCLTKQIPVLRLGPDEHNSILLNRNINVRSGSSEFLACSAQIQGRIFALGTRIPMLVKIVPFQMLKVEFSQVSILQRVSYQLLNRSVKNEPIAEFGFKDSGALSSKYNSKGKLLTASTEIGFSVLVPDNTSGFGENLLPTCSTGPIRVTHWLKIVLEFSAKGKTAFDIIFEVPIKLLSADCSKANSVLPEYNFESQDSSLPSYDNILPSRSNVHPPDYSVSPPDMNLSRESSLLKA